MKQQLLALPSGSIDLVFDGKVSKLQFNCSCQDALPYCHADCCRMQDKYGMEVTAEESKVLATRKVQTPSGPLVVLAMNPATNACLYLEDETSLCTLHVSGKKPIGCKEWHCSPGGVGEGIKVRKDGLTLCQAL